MSTPKPIHRLTLFKVTNDNDRDEMLDHYRGMKASALKDGKPYIQSIVAGKPFEDERSQGYTVAVHSVFACRADME
ncbi:MAG: hypothetical protein M1840_004809 [Geoglossum simile]|nr:MAG: hypothetical protein M1840_004809 [Geoglossum simile]